MYFIWVVLLVLSGAAMLPAPVDAARAGLADSTTVARPRFPSAPT